MPPRIVGVELDPKRAATAKHRFGGRPEVQIVRGDFLAKTYGTFDFIVGNPPYVSILGLDVQERERYRKKFTVARGRFDLYALFFEHSINQLAADGRLVFVTPEKYTYVDGAASLRALLLRRGVSALEFVREDIFPGRVTYPLITTISSEGTTGKTSVATRDGRRSLTRLRGDESWRPVIDGYRSPRSTVSLADVSRRISCGVATGADSVFVQAASSLPVELRRFAYQTISGRQIGADGGLSLKSVMLAPYDREGRLLAEGRLGQLGEYLARPSVRTALMKRSCAGRKPWYAFHDSFPIKDILRPKLICKDIGQRPLFVADRAGVIVPRHSVYYVVPEDAGHLEALLDYLNSPAAVSWLMANCQRAANGFVRLQSHVLKRLPVPESLLPDFVSNKELDLSVEMAAV